MRQALSVLSKTFLGWIFPACCINCNTGTTFLCRSCFLSLPILSKQHCHHCKERITPHGQLCFQCVGSTALDGLLAASPYKNPLVASVIHWYKYRFIQDLRHPLGEILLITTQHTAIPLPDIICPIPLHPYRLRWRGFNQAEHLAQALGDNLLPSYPLPVEQLLTRIKYTQPQMNIHEKEQRRRNIAGAFAISSHLKSKSLQKSLVGKYIWLVDDVATTTSTLEECARVLKENGVKKVFGIVVAR